MRRQNLCLPGLLILATSCTGANMPDVNGSDATDVNSSDMVTVDQPMATDVSSAMDADGAVDVTESDRPTPIDVQLSSDAGPVDRDFCTSGAEVVGLTVPPEFCVRKYSATRVARVMALAPNGDLFIASPARVNATGLGNGLSAIVVLRTMPNGTIQESMFSTGIENVHGLAFGDGYLWYTDNATVMRTPYTNGQLTENVAMRETVIGPGDEASTRLGGGGRATHGLSRSVSGRMFVTRGEYSQCILGPGGVRGVGTGEIYSLGMHTLTRVQFGFRNPMYTRCHFGRDLCLAAELGEDQTIGATEKLLVINGDRDWYGYPCCHTRTAGPRFMSGDCAAVAQEEVSIPLGNTPFGFDWERGRWPAPYRGALFVALHGSFYLPNFEGAGISYLPTDPNTAIPLRTEAVPFVRATNGMASVTLQRPSDLLFAPDGRMFVSDDYGGGVYMIAPRIR